MWVIWYCLSGLNVVVLMWEVVVEVVEVAVGLAPPLFKGVVDLSTM